MYININKLENNIKPEIKNLRISLKNAKEVLESTPFSNSRPDWKSTFLNDIPNKITNVDNKISEFQKWVNQAIDKIKETEKKNNNVLSAAALVSLSKLELNQMNVKTKDQLLIDSQLPNNLDEKIKEAEKNGMIPIQVGETGQEKLEFISKKQIDLYNYYIDIMHKNNGEASSLAGLPDHFIPFLKKQCDDAIARNELPMLTLDAYDHIIININEKSHPELAKALKKQIGENESGTVNFYSNLEQANSILLQFTENTYNHGTNNNPFSMERKQVNTTIKNINGTPTLIKTTDNIPNERFQTIASFSNLSIKSIEGIRKSCRIFSRFRYNSRNWNCKYSYCSIRWYSLFRILSIG